MRMETRYLKKLPGLDLYYYDYREAIEEIKPGSFEKLPYTSRLFAENLVRKSQGERLKDYLLQIIEFRRDMDFPWYPVRVVSHDILGQTALVDLAGLRDAIAQRGGPP